MKYNQRLLVDIATAAINTDEVKKIIKNATLQVISCGFVLFTRFL